MGPDFLKRAASISGMVAVCSLLPSTGSAAGLTLTPSISVEEQWDSNVFNSATDEVSDFVFRATPRLTLSAEAFHTTAGVTGGFEVNRYSSHKDLDEDSLTKNFSLNVAEPFQITPRFRLHPSASFVETNDSVRRNQLALPGGSILPPSESTVTTRTKERDYAASISMTYLVTPRLDLSVRGGVTKREFTDNVFTSNLVGSRTILGGGSALYRTTPRLGLGVFFDTTYDSFETGRDSRTYAGGLETTYQVSPSSFLNARAGASLARQSAIAGGESTEEWGPYATLSATTTWRTLRATLSGFAGFSGGGSFGTSEYREDVRLALLDQLSASWGLDLTGHYQRNRPAGDRGAPRLTTVDGSAGIRYLVTSRASIGLSGSVTKQWSSGPGDVDITRFAGTLGFSLGYPLKLL